MRLRGLHQFLSAYIEADPEADSVTIGMDELREILNLARPEAGTRGASIEDQERGVVYRVTLDTTSKPGEARLKSVEIERRAIPKGLRGWTAKGGDLRPKGKPGTYLAPYDEGVFRVPVQDLIGQALAVFESEEDVHVNPDGSTALVIGARQLAAPTAQQLREHVREGMTVQQIADRYQRKPRAVYGWLATARRVSPDLDWPEVKHGPTVGRGK